MSVVIAMRFRRQAKHLGALVATLRDQRQAFVERMSFEIRNPLNAILGLSAQLDGPDAGGAPDHQVRMSVLRGAAEQLLQTATNLELQAVGPAALGAPVVQDVALSPLLEDIKLALLPQAVQRKIHVDARIESGAPRLVRTDHDLVRSILINVLTHAITVSPRGAVELTVCDDASGSSPGLLITVLDTAPSLTPEAGRALFEGAGLDGLLDSLNTAGVTWSLPVARMMVEHLGGAICYVPHLSGGGVIEIRVPCEVVAAQEDTSQHLGTVVPFNSVYGHHRHQVHTLHVLVVEDQKSNQLLIQSILNQAGHTCSLVENTDDALEEIRHKHYHLVLLDLRLPGRPGLEVLRMVRLGMASVAPDVPIIVLTGESQREVREACLAAGATNFLSKPISATKLLNAIELIERDLPSTALSDEAREGHGASTIPEHQADLFRDLLRHNDDLGAYGRQQDWQQVRFTARAMRGVCRTLALPDVSRACRMLIDAEDEQLRTGLAGYLQLLGGALNKVRPG